MPAQNWYGKGLSKDPSGTYSKDTNVILRFDHFYLWSEVAFDQKADTEEQREDVERGDYFGKVLVDLDREVGQEVDEEEVAGKRHEVELDSVG